jgi:response regulator RpfG family c-di-GMP phosphodiesterase
MKIEILLIDDDKNINAHNEQIILSIKKDVHIDKFENPQDAFKYLLKKSIAPVEKQRIVIFLDLSMPNIAGFDFLDQIEEIELDLSLELAVYILSADESIYAQERILIFPIVKGFINKPLNINKVLELGILNVT